jgi:hypothetical protein
MNDCYFRRMNYARIAAISLALAVVLGSTDNVSVALLQWPSVPVSVTPAIDLLRSTPPATKQHRRRRRLGALSMES